MATNLTAPAGFSSSNLVYEENFSGTSLDSTWHPYITSKAANGWPWNDNGSGGSGPGGQYEADYDIASHATVSNGVLNLTATQDPIYGVNQGTWQTYPVTSGAVSSYGNFEFNGGYLQISMKAPSGDGAWPGLWLMPGKGSSSGDNFEIDMQEGGYTGSGNPNQAFSYHLHTPSGTVGGVVDTGIDLTAGFNTYGINWVPGQSITWYLNGKQIAQVTSAQAPIPNEPMELIMSNQVANSSASGWHTALDSSTPSSMQMQVDAIQLYQLPGSGNTVTGANVSPTTSGTSSSGSTTTGSGTTDPTTTGSTGSTTTGSTGTTTQTPPTVTQVTASPSTGVEHVGDTVNLTLAFNEVVTVTGTPTLKLNDGDVATYVSGSGTGSLVFSTKVASTDTATSALGITSVNLANGASIKDAAGTAADLSGAIKSFSGLSIDPATSTSTGSGTSSSGSTTTGSGSTGSTTDPTTVTTAPVVSVADKTLDVAAGGKVDLGIKVATTDPNDAVSVTINGLPRYETITDNLDGHVFQGKSITLTADQVNSGLTLQSNYHGKGSPVSQLTVTATGKDPATGATSTSTPQTITVTDPPATSTSTTGQGSSAGGKNVADHSGSANQWTGGGGCAGVHQQAALLNQYLAGGFDGKSDHGQIVTAATQMGGWQHDNFLAKPQH